MPPTIPPMIAPPAAGAPIFSASSFFVAAAVRPTAVVLDLVALVVAARRERVESHGDMRAALHFGRPRRVGDDAADTREPSASTVSPSTVIGREQMRGDRLFDAARCRSRRLCRGRSARRVPAGIVTSRQAAVSASAAAAAARVGAAGGGDRRPRSRSAGAAAAAGVASALPRAGGSPLHAQPPRRSQRRSQLSSNRIRISMAIA